MSFLNDRKDKFIIMADNPKRAASVISALDKLRREHYGDMPISTQDIKLVDRVMKLLVMSQSWGWDSCQKSAA